MLSEIDTDRYLKIKTRILISKYEKTKTKSMNIFRLWEFCFFVNFLQHNS